MDLQSRPCSPTGRSAGGVENTQTPALQFHLTLLAGVTGCQVETGGVDHRGQYQSRNLTPDLPNPDNQRQSRVVRGHTDTFLRDAGLFAEFHQLRP